MTQNRKKGDKYLNLLNTFDIEILNAVDKNKDIGVMELMELLNKKHVGLNRHIKRLYDNNLVNKIPIGKHGKKAIKLTEDGKHVLKAFKKYCV